MCNGIAVVVWNENGRIKGACNGVTSHDDLCHTIPILACGDIEPYRFELLYPQSLVYDRGHELPLGTGIFKEQPPHEIWREAERISDSWKRKHTKKQLQSSNLRGANLRGADLTRAGLREADLRWANLREADLRWANLREAGLREADLRGAYYDKETKLPENIDTSRMILI